MLAALLLFPVSVCVSLLRPHICVLTCTQEEKGELKELQAFGC